MESRPEEISLAEEAVGMAGCVEFRVCQTVLNVNILVEYTQSQHGH